MTSPTPTPTVNVSTTSLSGTTLLTVILVVIGLLVGTYIWTSAGKKDEIARQAAAYADSIKKYEAKIVTPTLKKADSLKTIAENAKKAADHSTVVAATQTVKIKSLIDSTKVLDSLNKSLERKLGEAPDAALTGQLINGLKIQVVVEQQTIDSLESRDSTRVKTITSLRTEAFAYKTRGDSLQKVIIDWPRPPVPKKLLGFIPPLPEKVALIVTAAAAAYAGYKVHK